MIVFPNGIMLPWGPFPGGRPDSGCLLDIGMEELLGHYLCDGDKRYIILGKMFKAAYSAVSVRSNIS